MALFSSKTQKSGTAVHSMTAGNPAGLIVRFAIPLMLGNLFQQFYTIADTLIVSRALGVEALAALGTTGWYGYLTISIIQALTQGFGIRMAQDFGAEDAPHLRRTVGSAIRLSIWSAVLLTAAALLTLPLCLTLLKVPAEIRPLTFTYLAIIFAGIPFQILFNLGATVLRSLGNSRTPLNAMLVASGVNIVLDLFLVVVIPLGIAGAAIATVLAQLLSGIYCLMALRKVSILKLAKSDLRRDLPLAADLLKLSAPMVAQNVLISVGGMVVSSVVNSFGVIFIAGFTATDKLIGALEMAATAYGYAMISYAGQNLGALRYGRIRRGYVDAVLIGTVTAGLIALVMGLLGRQITGLFLSGDPATVAAAGDIAYQYLLCLSIPLPILYLLHITRATLQGLGDTVSPMISGVLEFCMRVFFVLVLTRFIGHYSVFAAEISAWIGADLVLVPAYLLHLRRMPKEDATNHDA